MSDVNMRFRSNSFTYNLFVWHVSYIKSQDFTTNYYLYSYQNILSPETLSLH